MVLLSFRHAIHGHHGVLALDPHRPPLKLVKPLANTPPMALRRQLGEADGTEPTLEGLGSPRGVDHPVPETTVSIDCTQPLALVPKTSTAWEDPAGGAVVGEVGWAPLT